MAVKIVDLHHVSPSQGGGSAEQSLPLLYFHIIWLPSRPTETLYFYALECSEFFFLATIVDQLKQSLSLTLQHFLPLASKIIFPLAPDIMSVAQFTDGDSVPLTIATSDADFADMTGNHAKDADEFHHLAPQLPPSVYSADEIKFSTVAVQVTLFPGRGISIGFTHHHAICDAAPLFGFMRIWVAINKSRGGGGGGDDHRLRDFLPFCGRSSVQDADRLGVLSWNRIKDGRPTVSLTLPLPLHKLRATFVLTDVEVEKLKSFAAIKNPNMDRPSTFIVVTAHLWSCLAKSAGDEVDDDEAEYLGSPVDCRRRPPLPHNYFGNCLMLLVAVSTHGRLKGENGFLAAAEAISDAIVNGRGALDFHENRPWILSGLAGKLMVSIAGSTRLDPYAADYGLGMAVKFEFIHTDFNELGVQLFKGRDGGVEIGLSLSKDMMDSFAYVFNNFPYISSNS